MTEEPPMIPCTVEELNYFLDKWIGDGVVKPFTISRPPTEKVGSTIMLSISLRIVGSSGGFFTRS